MLHKMVHKVNSWTLLYIILHNTLLNKTWTLVLLFKKYLMGVFSLFFYGRLKEAAETHKKVEHEIKIAVFTLINEINKKGKSLLQQLEVWGSADAEIQRNMKTAGFCFCVP